MNNDTNDEFHSNEVIISNHIYKLIWFDLVLYVEFFLKDRRNLTKNLFQLICLLLFIFRFL